MATLRVRYGTSRSVQGNAVYVVLLVLDPRDPFEGMHLTHRVRYGTSRSVRGYAAFRVPFVSFWIPVIRAWVLGDPARPRQDLTIHTWERGIKARTVPDLCNPLMGKRLTNAAYRDLAIRPWNRGTTSPVRFGSA